MIMCIECVYYTRRTPHVARTYTRSKTLLQYADAVELGEQNRTQVRTDLVGLGRRAVNQCIMYTEFRTPFFFLFFIHFRCPVN